MHVPGGFLLETTGLSAQASPPLWKLVFIHNYWEPGNASNQANFAGYLDYRTPIKEG